MILKNEEKVIARCLKSVLPHVSRVAIVDTGSTDDTQDMVIGQCMARDDDYYAYETRDWSDFSTARNQALDLARKAGTDYILMLDASDELFFAENFAWPNDGLDGYMMRQESQGCVHLRTQLVKSSAPWKYRYRAHEALTFAHEQASVGLVHGCYVVNHQDSHSSEDKAAKFKKYADLLQSEYDETENPDAGLVYRYAQACRDAERLEDSLRLYTERVNMGGWEEEAWHAHYQRCMLMRRLDYQPQEVVWEMLKCYARRPIRSEPLLELAVYLRGLNEPHLARLVAMQAASIPMPANEILIVDIPCYAWRCALEAAMSLQACGDARSALKLYTRLLSGNALPEGERRLVTGFVSQIAEMA